MGKQLIFCVETNKNNQSDWIYIKEILGEFYQNNNVSVKYSKVFLDGKGNYNATRVNNEKKQLISQYKAASSDNESIVLYVFDTDDFDSKSEDQEFWDRIETYCKQNDYRLVFFCKDIERVLINEKIETHQKKKRAEQFKRYSTIKSVDVNKLNSEIIKYNSSNILIILDDYLKRKNS